MYLFRSVKIEAFNYNTIEYSSMSEVKSALNNLQKIKQGNDPLTKQSSHTTNITDPLKIAQIETNRLYKKYNLQKYLDRNKLHVAIANWKGRNGVCKYNVRPKKKRFGLRMTVISVSGHHTIGIDEQIIEDSGKDEFLDTVRHELAHAICYAKHGCSQKHNHNWKRMARKFDADPSSSHNKKDTDYKYYLGCPDCGLTIGKLRRSKKIKKPFTRICSECRCELVSYDAGDVMPQEHGTVAVKSIPWNNKEEWRNHK